MQEITAYKPKCCDMTYIDKESAIRHAQKCPRNPDNRACNTCKNLLTGYDYIGSYNYCEPTRRKAHHGLLLALPKIDCEYWEGKDV